MRKWSLVALLVVGAMVLGATVLREPVASAASAVLNTNIVGPLDAQGDVRVHEQGTVAAVSVPKHPFNKQVQCSFSGEGSCFATIPVPEGNLLVIETVSAASVVAVPDTMAQVILRARTGEDFVGARIPAIDNGQAGSFNTTALTQQVRIYSDSDVQFQAVARGFPEQGTALMSVFGYLVPTS